MKKKIPLLCFITPAIEEPHFPFFSGIPASSCHDYGIHPQFTGRESTTDAVPSPPLVPLQDRVQNLHAMTCAMVAECSLSLNTVPTLIAWAKVI